MHPDLTHLQRIEELETMLTESSHRPLLLFKHSVSCGTSFEALDQLIDHLNKGPAAAFAREARYGEPRRSLRHRREAGHYVGGNRLPARYAMITVQTHGELSTAVARRLGVRHETPQALLIREGRVVWSASHFRVTADAVEAAIRAQGRSIS